VALKALLDVLGKIFKFCWTFFKKRWENKKTSKT